MTDREFHSRYLSLAEALYGVAFYILENEADAEDAVQELYLKLWKNRDALDGIRSPKAYAMTLLRNLCLDRIRQARKLSVTEVPESLGGSFDPVHLGHLFLLHCAVSMTDYSSFLKRVLRQKGDNNAV